MKRARLVCLALVAALAGVALVAAPAQADVVMLSGVIRTDVGTPIGGLTVSTFDSGSTTSPSTTTAGDGSYQLPVERGREIRIVLNGDYAGVPGNFYAESAAFTPTAPRAEDMVIPGVVPVHVHVEEYDGRVSVGASVTPQPPSSITQTSGGLKLASYLTGWTCHTNLSGVCDVQALRNGSIGGFAIEGQGRDAEQFPSITVPSEIHEFFRLTRAQSVSGVLVTSAGSPIAGAVVSVGSERQSTTGADGSFEVWATPGSQSLRIKGMVGQGGWTVPFEVQSATFTLDRPRTFSLTLPEVETLRVRVRDAVGEPVPDARVDVTGPASISQFSFDGIAFTGYLLREGGPLLTCMDTDAEGACGFAAFAGGSHGQIFVTTPTNRAVPDAELQSVAGDEVIARLPKFATAVSSGSSDGRLSADLYTGSEILGFHLGTIELPDGLEAPVGRIDYQVKVAQPGAVGRIDVDLPPGATANALVRVDSDGQLVAIGTNDSDPLRVSVGDGTSADLDGVADGVVTANVVPVVKQPIQILTDELAGAAKGKSYRMQLDAAGPGSPFTWTVADGALPPGLALGTDGVIGGVPTTLGGSGFTVRVADRFGFIATRSYFLYVSTIAVTTRSVPDAFVNAAYSVPLEYTGGGAFPTWRLAGGTLPPGLKLASGKISGTPTTIGAFTFWVTVTSNGATSYPAQKLTLVVKPMEIATTSLPDAPVWSSYSQKLTTHGGKSTLVWSVAGGSLPPGVVLSSAGALSGKPTTVGSYPVTFKVKDALGQVATKSFVITVTPMTITTTSLPNVKKGAYYSQFLAVSGGKATLTWSLASGTLPTGLTLSTAGRITGYPKTPGTWTFTVKVADSAVPKNTATRTLSITVT